MAKVNLTWYGRCCFKIDFGKVSVLTDPHDAFDGVDIGIIDADYTLISSVAHDHGHIGANPGSRWNHGEEGEFETKEGIKIAGIKSREERGDKNIIFNIQFSKFSITNFADWGNVEDIQDFTDEELKTLKSTNICLVRPNLVKEGPLQMAELALKVCEPAVIIPHHSYPAGFVRKYPTDKMLSGLAHYKPLVHKLVGKLDYEVKEINSYKTTISESDLKKKSVLLFSHIHPQVKGRENE